MNFNFSGSNEYQLNRGLIDEMISLYGVLVKFMVAERIGVDDNVFGDYSHLKSDASKIYDVYMLPENTESFDTGEYGFGNFGFLNYDNVSFFVSKTSLDTIPSIDFPKGVVGNLLVMPNSKVLEITHADWNVPGVNNLFVYPDQKSTLKITCKPHEFKIVSEIDDADIDYDGEEYPLLDQYFTDLEAIAVNQDNEGHVDLNGMGVENAGDVDVKVHKPTLDKTEPDVWGSFS